MKKRNYWLFVLAIPVIWFGGRYFRPLLNPQASPRPDEASIEYFLTTGISDGKMVFIGIGGDIDGIANPDLLVSPEGLVSITLVNGDNLPHDFSVPELFVHSAQIATQGRSASVRFVSPGSGNYEYICSLPGHQQAGMQGIIKVILEN